MPPTAELLRQLKPPPEIELITRFCDDVTRRRRPQRLALVQPMRLHSAQPITSLQLMGRWGLIPEQEVSVWPTLFHVQDIEYTDVVRFLDWLHRMQTREADWFFASPEMTFPLRPMAPFLGEEAAVRGARPTGMPGWEGAGQTAAAWGYVPMRGAPESLPPEMAWPSAGGRADRVFTADMQAFVPTRAERKLPDLADAFVPTRRSPVTGSGFVPIGEQADSIWRTMSAQRLRAVEAEAGPLKPPALNISPAAGTGPAPGGRGIAPAVTFGIAVPAALALIGAAASPLLARPVFTPLTAAGWGSAPLSTEAPSPVFGPRALMRSPMDADRGQMTPSPIGGVIPIPYPQLPVADWRQGAGSAFPMLSGKVTWQLPSGREWTSHLRVPMPGAGSAPIPYPQVAGMDFNRLHTVVTPVFPGLTPGVTGPTGAGGWTALASAPAFLRGFLQPVNVAGFMAADMQRPGEGRAPAGAHPLAPGTLLENPYLGQMTLIAPPLRVASEEAEDSGTAVAFNWETLAKGQRPLDAGGLSALRRVLPEGTRLIYPALPKGQLPAGAVNLRLAQPTVAHLLEAGYGVPPDTGMAARVVSGTVASIGATPQAMPLAGHIVPGKRPAGMKESMLPTRDDTPGGALPQIGTRQAKRGGALDFLGLPISLAPRLGSRSEVREAVSSNLAQEKAAGAIRPHVFGPLRHALFPSFHSIEAEPDRRAWEKAAPSFGLRDGHPMTVLTPQARAPMLTPSTSLPQTGGVRPSMPGSLPQTHVAGPAPVRHAVEGLDGMAPHRAPAPAYAPSFGGMPGRAFRPIASPSIGAGTSWPHAMPTGGPSALTGTSPVQAGAPRRGISGASPAMIGSHAPLSVGRPAGTGAGSSPSISMPFTRGVTRAPEAPSSAMRPFMPSSLLSSHMRPPAPMPRMQPSGLPAFSLPAPASSATFPSPASGAAGIPGPNMHLSAPPSVTSPDRGMQSHTTLLSRAPAMLYTPPSPRGMTATAPLAIQRATGEGAASAHSLTREQGAESATSQSATASRNEGQQGAEINVLATEVWSLLKQRLATEAIRRGRW